MVPFPGDALPGFAAVVFSSRLLLGCFAFVSENEMDSEVHSLTACLLANSNLVLFLNCSTSLDVGFALIKSSLGC